MKLLRFFLVLTTFMVSLPVMAAKIVVSIEPLAMLVEPLLGPDDSVHVLLKPNTSPHHYSLKASDMQALQQADVIMWVGPTLEQFLQKPLAALSTSLPLGQLPGLSWPAEAAHAEVLGEHTHGDRDPHLWLNPDNGLVIARAVAQRLATLPSTDTAAVGARLAKMEARIQLLIKELELSLNNLKDLKFIAYHQAYGHWNQRFGLTQLSAVSLTPEQRPGARHIYALKRQAKQAQCLVAEAFYNNQTSQQLAAELALPLVLLDPLGNDVKPSAYRYEMLLRNLANDMAGCLTGPKSGLSTQY